MKTLSTEQQQELQELIHNLPRHNLDFGVCNQLDYWAIELKPKRVRKKSQDSTNIIDNIVTV
jgi:hypothetical protein